MIDKIVLKSRTFALLAAFVALISTSAFAAVSFSIGTGGFYVSVGDYDYLPYAYVENPAFVPPPINFHDALSEYGAWVQVPPFGAAWQPYAAAGWRPYLYGHWNYTSQYGPMWEGYEPWGWIGYHYGNWVYSRDYGWIWIPGDDWHPGRVAWAQSYNGIGWMPLPPSGYDYSRGDIAYIGPDNQFAYQDGDFGSQYGSGNYNYGGPYYDPRYRNMYYNQGYRSLVPNLWVFVDVDHFDSGNVADGYLGPTYAGDVFNRRLVRVSTRIQKPELEQILRRPVREVPVQEHEIQTDRRRIKVVVPATQTAVEEIRRHRNETVQDVIAPAFAKKDKAFKGSQARNNSEVAKIFNQNAGQPKVQQMSSEDVVRRAEQNQRQRQEQMNQRESVARQRIEQGERDGVFKEPQQKRDNQNQAPPPNQVNPPDQGSQQQEQNNPAKNQDKQKKHKNKKDKDNNPPPPPPPPPQF